MAVTDQEIIARLRVLLGESDLQTTTEKMLRKKLEEEFKMDMLDKKPIIRQEIEKYLAEQGGEEDEEGDGQEDEKEEKDGPVKGSSLGCLLSEPMQKFLGVETLPRTQVVKRLWEYIKANNLQDPKDKRKILLDDKLKTLFTPPVTMFSINTQISKHCKTADACEQPRKRAATEDKEKEKPKPKKSKAGGEEEQGEKKATGFNKPQKVSADLASWYGKDMATRSDVTKFFWTYVKEHKLQDAADKRNINCDATLKKLTGQDTLTGFSFPKFISPHFLKS